MTSEQLERNLSIQNPARAWHCMKAGQKVVGYFCCLLPGRVVAAFGMLPYRIQEAKNDPSIRRTPISKPWPVRLPKLLQSRPQGQVRLPGRAVYSPYLRYPGTPFCDLAGDKAGPPDLSPQCPSHDRPQFGGLFLRGIEGLHCRTGDMVRSDIGYNQATGGRQGLQSPPRRPARPLRTAQIRSSPRLRQRGHGDRGGRYGHPCN